MRWPWEEGQLYFPVWNTDQSAILLCKNNPRASCEIWHLTLQLALGAIFPAFFCRLWASVPRSINHVIWLVDWRGHGVWSEVERNRQETSLISADRMAYETVLLYFLITVLFLSIGTERNKFRPNGPKWKIVHLQPFTEIGDCWFVNWTDGNIWVIGQA